MESQPEKDAPKPATSALFLNNQQGMQDPIHVQQFFEEHTVEALLRFGGIAFTVDNLRMPKLAGTGALPAVYDSTSRETYSGESAARAVAELVRDEEHNVQDSRLSASDRASCTAFCSLLLDDLKDAQLFGSWADEEEYGKHTLPCLRRQMGWLPAQLTATTLRRQMLARLRARGWTSERIARRRTLVAYRALATLLAERESDWVFGSQPSTLDALLYGHLHAVRHTLPMRWLVQAACQQRSRLGPPSLLIEATRRLTAQQEQAEGGPLAAGGVAPVGSEIERERLRLGLGMGGSLSSVHSAGGLGSEAGASGLDAEEEEEARAAREARGSVQGAVGRPLPSWVSDAGAAGGSPGDAEGDVSGKGGSRSVAAVLHSRLHLAHGPDLASLVAACGALRKAKASSPSGPGPLAGSTPVSGAASFDGDAAGGSWRGTLGPGAKTAEAEADFAALLRHYARAADLMLNPAERAVAVGQHAEENAFAADAAARDAVEVAAFEGGIDLAEAKRAAEEEAKAQGELFRMVLGGVAVAASAGIVVYGFSRQWWASKGRGAGAGAGKRTSAGR